MRFLFNSEGLPFIGTVSQNGQGIEIPLIEKRTLNKGSGIAASLGGYMIPQVFKTPRFQKWSLFTSLVLSLGFNLSMNPQAPQLARNQVHTLDLAQLAAPATTGVNPADPNLSFGSVINLGEKTSDERLKQYGVVLTLNVEGDKVSYIIKKKNTEGYTSEGCEECSRKYIDTPKQFDKNNAAHIQAVLAKIAGIEQEKLMKAPKTEGKDNKAEADKKSTDKNGHEMFAESCRDKSDDEIMDCQYDVITKEIEACPKWSASCESKLKAKFKPFDDMFKACSRRTSSSRLKSAEDTDCDSAKEFAENILADMPSAYALKKAASFMQTSVLNQTSNLRDQLIRKHVDAVTLNNWVRAQYDRTANAYGSSVLKNLSLNDHFKSQDAVLDFYGVNYNDALVDTRKTIMTTDLSTGSFPTIGFDSTGYGITPPELSQYRGILNTRTGGITMPNMPTVDAVPASNRPAPTSQISNQVVPGTVMQSSGPGFTPTVGGTLLSPAQRGQFR